MTVSFSPFLICIGGFSGTGKSTLARGLLPYFPDAVHIDSDHVRKALFHVAPTDKLPAEAYSREASLRVYAEMHRQATEALQAGKTVIISATFTVEDGRKQIEDLATQNGAMFKGLWLEADLNILFNRVAKRTNDASDATPDVVAYQAKAPLGEITWNKIASGGSAQDVLQEALKALAPTPVTVKTTAPKI